MTYVPNREFHPIHAAFAGYRLIRQRWRPILAWAALRFLINLAVSVLVVHFAGKGVKELVAFVRGDSPEGSLGHVLSVLFHGMEPIVAITLPLNLLVQSVLLSATFRAMLHPERSRWAYLRLGRQELGVAGAYILWYVLFIAAFGLFEFLIMFTVPLAQATSPVLGILLGVIEAVGVVCLTVWAFVRTSLTFVDSYERRAISLFHSLRLTKGHFWWLLWSYAVALGLFLAAYLLFLLVAVLLTSIAALASGQGLSAVHEVMTEHDPATLISNFSLVLIVYSVLNAIGVAAIYPAAFGPTVEAYMTFKAQGEGEPDRPDEPHQHWPKLWKNLGERGAGLGSRFLDRDRDRRS